MRLQSKVFARSLSPFVSLAIGIGSSLSALALDELKDIVSISAGGSHTCGITTARSVKCWGSNYSGQLGDGTRLPREFPVDVVGLGAPVAAVSAGGEHTCAVLPAGGVKCWGSNSTGQVGVSEAAAPWYYPPSTYPAPVDAWGLTSGMISVATGNNHTCALTSSGGVKCWGKLSSSGVLGDIPGPESGVTGVAVSGFLQVISPRSWWVIPSSCALTTGGGVQCWGTNGGSGYVTGLESGVQSISLGGQGCAVTAAGGVKCWGLDSLSPVDVPRLSSGVSAVSVGRFHACALVGGGVKCWGGNTYGQIGDNSTTDRSTPVDVPGLSNGVAAVSAGGTHTCALTTQGTVRCWGAAYGDQMGNGEAVQYQLVPTAVLAGTVPRLVNISTRAAVQSGENVLINGFIITGNAPKKVLITARGPSLSMYGVPGVLADPVLQLFSGQSVIASNDTWELDPNAADIQATGIAPADSRESALIVTLDPGPYTAIVSGAGGTTGVAIVEVFERDHPETPLINVSTRGKVGTGDNVMIGGFIIQGDAPQTVLIIARGPSLANFGITSALANPQLQVFSGETLIYSNDDWQTQNEVAGGSSAVSRIGNTGIAPPDMKESALLVTLPPGAYTAIVSGVGGGTGVGIVEVFAQ